MDGPQLIRSSGFVVYKHDHGRVLFLLLKSTRDGYWGPPKGHLEQEEEWIEAALRELAEETGADDISMVDQFRATIYYNVRKSGVEKAKRVDFFLGEKKDSRVEVSAEHSDYRWVTLKEAEELLAFENLKTVFREAYEAVVAR